MGERYVAVKLDQLKWSNEPVKSTDSKKRVPANGTPMAVTNGLSDTLGVARQSEQ
jgi:hypothetical protein